MLHRGFKPAKCKTALNLAKSRIKLMKNRKDIQLKQLKREVAQLLDSGQDQTARIRVEHVIREEKMIAAYEMIEIYCELIVARLPIIESQKNCPLDLKEAIASLIFAAPRCGDITELQDVRKHFTAKYGKEFASAAAEVRPGCGVSRTLVEKLSVNAPDGQTKVKILTAIGEEHNIKWEPNWFKEEDPVPSVDIPKVAVAQSVEGSKIQMQPLNYELADDLEENHSRDKARPGTSSQSHAHRHSDLVLPSSTSHPDPRPSESSSEKMKFFQSSPTVESTFGTGRQNWNMEFKDATAAAQAAAESAEMASFAARAAAELASRSNAMSDDQHHSAGSGLQQNRVHRNSISGSFNQKSPRVQNQGDSYRQGNMTEGSDATSLNKDYTQYGEYETGKQDFTERKNSRRHTRDADSTPIIYKAEDEYEIDPSENPFHETVERKNHSRSFQSQSSDFEDECGVFTNLNYNNKHDSGDGYLSSFSRKADDQDWHGRSAYMFDEEDTTYKDHREGNTFLETNHREENIFDSGNNIFVGMDHKASGTGLDEKEIHTNSEVFFDESGSDDEEDISDLNPKNEHNFHAPDPTSIGSSVNQDNRHFEPDLSESFRRSSMYSKLTEPISLNFDDSDGENSGSEEELEKEKFDLGVPSYDNQMPGVDPHLELKSSNVEKRVTDYSMSGKHLEEKQNRYSGSSESSYENSSTAPSTGFKSRTDYDLSYEGGPQKSLQSLRHSESRHPDSEFENETQPTLDGGMGLNLGLLPGGRRNRAHERMPKVRVADASSPSRSTEASPSNTFGSNEKAFTFEFQSSSSQIDNRKGPVKTSGLHTSYDSSSDDNEVIITRKDLGNAEEVYRATSTIIDGNTHKTRLKDSTRCFDSDDGSSEEDVPKPVVSKTFLGAGLSRRTKTSAPRTVASSNASDTAKMGRFSSSYNTESPSSRIIGQSSWDDDQNLAAKSSKDDRSSSSSVPEKPVTPKRPVVPEVTNSNEKAPSRENSTRNPSHVHPKLPDFDTITAQLHSVRRNR